MRTYQIKLWNNYGIISALSILLFIFGLGLAMYLVGVAFLIEGVVSFLGIYPTLSNISGFVGLFVAVIFIYSGHMCLWGFFSTYKMTVAFNDKEIIYKYPRMLFFFLFKTKIVPYSAIRGIFIGHTMMKKVYPEYLNSVPKDYLYKYMNSGLEVYFEKEGKIKILNLPIFNKYPEYYSELKRLIANLNLQQTDSKCLFAKVNSI